MAVTSPVTNYASTMLGGDLSLARGPMLGRNQNTGSDSRMESNLLKEVRDQVAIV